MIDEIDLHVTNKCNLNCYFCSTNSNSIFTELSLNQIYNIIDEAYILGLKHLHLTGGEPTIRSDLVKVINYAYKKNIITRVITNGSLLDKEMLNRFVDAGLKEIMVSIDGFMDVHDVIRGCKGVWSNALTCIINSIKLGLKTRISSVVFKNNVDQIYKLVKFSNGIGAHIFSFFMGTPVGRATKCQNFCLSPIEWTAFIKKIKKKFQKIIFQ